MNLSKPLTTTSMPFDKPPMPVRKPKTRGKKRGGALNKLYGEALNKKPTGFNIMNLSKKRLPKMNERSKRSIQLDRARKSKQKHEIEYQKRKGKKTMPVGTVEYKKRNGKIGYKVRKINKKTGKKYWKYL